jgi:hypothetical protein
MLATAVKSAEILKKKALADVHYGRAILILAYSVFKLPVSGLERFATNTEIDLVSQARELITTFLLVKKVSAELFDIALEGIGVVWLRYPLFLRNDEKTTRRIFTCI